MLRKGYFRLALFTLSVMICIVPRVHAAPKPKPEAEQGSVSTKLPKMTVKGAKVNAPPLQVEKNALQTTTTVTRTKINQVNPTSDFAHAINDLPNVNVFSTNGNGINGSSIQIRGFNSYRLDFNLDGIPLNDAGSYSFYSNEYVPNSALNKIDFAPGAGSAASLGSSNFGGSVGLRTLEPKSYPYLKLFGGYGSYALRKYGATLNSGLFAKDYAPTSAYGLFSKTESDGYYTHDRSFKDDQVFKLESELGGGKLTLFYSANQQFQQYTQGATTEQRAKYGRRYSGYNEDPTSTDYYGYNYNDYHNWVGYAKYANSIGPVKLSNQAYYYWGNGYGAGASSFNGVVSATHSINYTNRVGDIVKMDASLGNLGDVQAGFWYQYNHTDHYSPHFDLTPSHMVTRNVNFVAYSEYVQTTTMQPYLQAPINLTDWLTINPGVKYYYLHRNFYDRKSGSPSMQSGFHKWLPSVGINYALTPDLHLYANYTRSARAPEYSQFYSGRFNPTLAPETANDYEIGSYWQSGAWSGRFSIFRTDFHDFIRSVTFGQGSRTYSQQTNAGRAKYEGVELSNHYEFTNWLTGFVNVGILNAQRTTLNKPIIGASHHTAAAGLIVDYQRFSGDFEVHDVGSRLDNLYGDGLYELPTRISSSLSVHYHVPTGSHDKRLDIGVYVNNLFNRHQILTAGGPTDAPFFKVNQPTTVFAEVKLGL